MSASETTFSHFNLKILMPKVMKNITNLRKKFCEFPPRLQSWALVVSNREVVDKFAHKCWRNRR